MEGYYFAKYEQIEEGKEEHKMIIMDIKVDNFYAFKNFHMNMSYPKKIVESMIEGEFLKDRPNFRYKKVNIIMGGNATGKTSLGMLLMRFTNYFDDGGYRRFTKIIDNPKKPASLQIDFVTNVNYLYRFDFFVEPRTGDDYTESDINVQILRTPIHKKDNYELCAQRIDENDCEEIFYEDIDAGGWHFSYPEDAGKNKTYIELEDDEKYIHILTKILQTLDPSIKSVVKLAELDNTYAVKWENCNVIIKEGKIVDGEVMSSGTKAGVDISYIIASLIFDIHDLYYCDELFSYVHSEVEKACLSIIIDELTERKQLFFTTHNTDILDMQLPKHSFAFLKKDADDEEQPIKCVYADQYLKRNTDNLKNAVENDLFCVAPKLHKLFEIVDL